MKRPKLPVLRTLKQVAAVPLHFVAHQWRSSAGVRPAKIRFGAHPRQYLMWGMPKADVQRVVVFYHGGGWRLGWPDQFPTVAQWFMAQGCAVALPAYRLLPRYNFGYMLEDVRLAWHTILELTAKHQLDKKGVIAGGMSAGATLAAHLAFNPLIGEGIAAAENRLSGFLSFAGPLDLNALPDLPQVRSFTGGPGDSPAHQAANPINLLTGTEQLPALLVHGNADAIVPYESSLHFYERYQGPKQLVTLEGASHLDSLRFALDDTQTAAKVAAWLQDK